MSTPSARPAAPPAKIIEDMFDVPPLKFFDNFSHKEMMYVYPDTKHWCAGWLLFKAKSGEWVTLRKAAQSDIEAINRAVSEAHHDRNI